MKIGLVILMVEDPRLGRAPHYAEIRERAQRAEAQGFDSIWLYDHLLYRREGQTIGIWECWTMLSALAEATQRVEIGSLVLCNSFRNPAILAKMATTLDEVSDGRFILGLGAGWNQPEYEAFGMPYDHRASRFEEALQIIRPLVKEGRVDFAGRYYQARACEIAPRGPRPNGPPILVGGDQPRMLELIARYADQWNIGYLGQPQDLAEPLARLHAACQRVGRDPSTLGVTCLLALGFPDLGDQPRFTEDYLTGSEQEIAAAMQGYADLGVEHLMFHLVPNSTAALERLEGALKLFRQAGS